jgi:hypothetical protein
MVKLSLCLSKHYAMKAYEGDYIHIQVSLTSALLGGDWSASRPDRFTSGERVHGTHWIGGWVDPRACMDNMERRKFLTSSGLELRSHSSPARSQSLYRLRYRFREANCSSLILMQENLPRFETVFGSMSTFGTISKSLWR